LLPTQPNDIYFLEGHRVPNCLSHIRAPLLGWKQIPVGP
jgi:hypothetical protein